MQARTLGELAEYVGGRVVGDRDIIIRSAATLKGAGEGDISFLANRKYESQLETTRASAVVASKEGKSPAVLLIVDDPYFAFREIVVLLHGHRKHKKTGTSDKASVAKTAVLGKDCQIHNFVTISDNAAIGDRCVLYPGVFIGEKTIVGDDCILYPNVVIYEDCRVGNRVTIHANSTIGEDGFGFATHKGEHHKIPHIGRAVIEDDVDIGACCGIERGTLDDTVIGKGSKLGDLVKIGHGVKIGSYSLLVAQVGIAGSTTVGHHCALGGQVGVVGHINIGNKVKIAAQSGVINDVEDGKEIAGTPGIDANTAKRAYSLIEYLPEIRKKIRTVEKRLARLEKPAKS